MTATARCSTRRETACTRRSACCARNPATIATKLATLYGQGMGLDVAFGALVDDAGDDAYRAYSQSRRARHRQRFRPARRRGRQRSLRDRSGRARLGTRGMAARPADGGGAAARRRRAVHPQRRSLVSAGVTARGRGTDGHRLPVDRIRAKRCSAGSGMRRTWMRSGANCAARWTRRSPAGSRSRSRSARRRRRRPKKSRRSSTAGKAATCARWHFAHGLRCRPRSPPCARAATGCRRPGRAALDAPRRAASRQTQFCPRSCAGFRFPKIRTKAWRRSGRCSPAALRRRPAA